MSLCVAGITGLQLFWNYQNYKQTVYGFKRDINEALNQAVNREINNRHDKIVARFKGWMADTSFVQITCNIKSRDSLTAFTMRDTHPYEPGDKGTTMGLADFKEKLRHITPAAKAHFIRHFGDNILRTDLQKGVIYYYTQRLGDSLSKVFNESKLDPNLLKRLYKQELLQKGIHEPFDINPSKDKVNEKYFTQQVNTALRRPYQKEMVSAGFENPNIYFFKEMKWLIITSFLLIGVTISCLIYTLKTLLSQHKLSLLKDDFINNMTHEINTPLSSIAITAEALRKYNPDEQTRDEYLGIISYQTEKLSNLTEQILNINKHVVEKKASYSRVELSELIRTTCSDLEAQIKHADVKVCIAPVAQPVYIHANILAMQNVATNIIDNALKYNLPGGHLNISIWSYRSCATIIFADNGIGIAKEYHSKVFDKFFRVPKGNTHDVKGYGLGLSYVKQVVEQHGGTVSVALNEPSGTLFTIKLPLC